MTEGLYGWRTGLFFIAVISVAMGAWYFGNSTGSSAAVQTALVLDARETRIMEHVIERNPDATIKDFSGFPRTLLSVSAKYNLDYRLIMALIDKESEFNPKAVGRAGEIGLMQIMPDTAKLLTITLKLDWTPPTPKKGGGYATLGTLGNPQANIEIGVAFLAERIEKFGDVKTGLRAYNRGDAAARQHRPGDRYAEGVALNYMALVPRMP